eukprot:CAMPEP_0173344560 /NCGR_PEP_ID=MMETSP1144-20121109/11458_2 /TAXON_ID=483371 /ORGANISM="non described non described, Strain CCMP2298" /LENGTH=68 /DNA_ID=CAMNT_0014291533 /DNA_START=70 /DNA_END=276 /DNA_ORIENTATION=-
MPSSTSSSSGNHPPASPVSPALSRAVCSSTFPSAGGDVADSLAPLSSRRRCSVPTTAGLPMLLAVRAA